MRIQFDQNQQYQLDAIASIVDVFDGQPLAQGQFEVDLGARQDELVSELGRGNALALSEEALLENVREVQKRNGLPAGEKLEGRNFTVEMETGTGKTYVYLRTIYELHARYGFSKFIIVVPSVAIREGVRTSLEIMKPHFAALYGNPPCDFWIYDGRRVSTLRPFATANTLQILIINIQAFDKSATIINKENDRMSGRRPIEFVQAAHPIVILDEPQNMETEIAKKAIESLNPLCTLRYSATHKNVYNLLYRLGPVKAYDLNLVKRIEVDSVLESEDFNRPYVCVETIAATKTKVTAKIEIDVRMAGEIKRKTVAVSEAGADLRALSGGRDIYEGYSVEEINAGEGYVTFSNGVTLATGQSHGNDPDAVMRAQIFETVKEHLDKELKIHRALPEGRRVKVLSLFFIDRVANYVNPDGKIRRWFVEACQTLAARERYRPPGAAPRRAGPQRLFRAVARPRKRHQRQNRGG